MFSLVTAQGSVKDVTAFLAVQVVLVEWWGEKYHPHGSFPKSSLLQAIAFSECASREEEIDSSSVQDGRHVQTASAGLVTRQNKSGPVQSGESQLLRVSSGETQGEEVVPFQNLKNAENKSELADCKPDSPEKCQPSKLSDAVVPLADEEDGCPTCLEEYDGENPRIITKCDHHFHLSCILEWMERSDTCPICDQEMIFNETT